MDVSRESEELQGSEIKQLLEWVSITKRDIWRRSSFSEWMKLFTFGLFNIGFPQMYKRRHNMQIFKYTNIKLNNQVKAENTVH